MLKIIYFTWRPLEANPRGQPGTDLKVSHNMPHVCLNIGLLGSIFVSKIIYCSYRPLEADPGDQPGTDLEVSHNMPS